MAKNATPEQSEQSKKAMADLFSKSVKDAERFKIAYAFDTDVSTTTFVVRKTTYTYVSYILGYDEAAQEIVLLETEPGLKETGEAIYLPRADVQKGLYSKMTTNYNLRVPKLKKGYIEFCVPVVTDDPELYPLILQEKEAEDFNKFFMANFTSGDAGGSSTMDSYAEAAEALADTVKNIGEDVKGKLKGFFKK